jgi:hypothetical protein
MSVENRAAAYGFFPPESQLENVVRALNHAGFESTNLCLLLTADHPIAERVRNSRMQAARAPVLGTDPEQILAWRSRYGAVVISEIGLFVGSSDFLHVLALPENLLRPERVSELFGMFGISPSEAARYRSPLRRNAAFILVSCEHEAHSEWARELLSAMGAEGASLLGAIRTRREPRPSRRQSTEQKAFESSDWKPLTLFLRLACGHSGTQDPSRCS